MSLMGISSLLILTSVSMYLRNFHLFTERYKKKSKFFAIISEIIFSSLMMEVATLVIWTRFEALIEFMMKTILKENKLNLYDEIGGDSMLGFIIMSASTYFLIYSIMVTENSMNVANYFVDMIGKLQTRPFKCPQEMTLNKNPQIKRNNIRIAKPATH